MSAPSSCRGHTSTVQPRGHRPTDPACSALPRRAAKGSPAAHRSRPTAVALLAGRSRLLHEAVPSLPVLIQRRTPLRASRRPRLHLERQPTRQDGSPT